MPLLSTDWYPPKTNTKASDLIRWISAHDVWVVARHDWSGVDRYLCHLRSGTAAVPEWSYGPSLDAQFFSVLGDAIQVEMNQFCSYGPGSFVRKIDQSWVDAARLLDADRVDL